MIYALYPPNIKREIVTRKIILDILESQFYRFLSFGLCRHQ